nr:hypothetical protein OG409_36325 [Streptomyces sp. NBC_00974]
MTYVHSKSGEVKERRGRIAVMMRVRGFYLDIQEWAHEDPFWAQWAVPSRITRGDGAGNHKIYKETTARMHQRVRERLPHLPLLIQTAERVHREAAACWKPLAPPRSTGSSSTAGRATCVARSSRWILASGPAS